MNVSKPALAIPSLKTSASVPSLRSKSMLSANSLDSGTGQDDEFDLLLNGDNDTSFELALSQLDENLVAASSQSKTKASKVEGMGTIGTERTQALARPHEDETRARTCDVPQTALTSHKTKIAGQVEEIAPLRTENVRTVQKQAKTPFEPCKPQAGTSSLKVATNTGQIAVPAKTQPRRTLVRTDSQSRMVLPQDQVNELLNGVGDWSDEDF